MSTFRRFAAALVCAVVLSVVGATTVGAQGPARCNKLALLTTRLEAKQARLGGRSSDRVAQLDKGSGPNPVPRLQEKVARLQARCSS